MGLLVLSLACVSRTHMPYCEVVYEGPVSDDEETPIGSVNALLDHVHVEVQRGEGSESAPWVTGARAAAPDEIPAFDGEEVLAGVEQLELNVSVLANQGDVVGGQVTWTGREEGEDPESVTGRVLSFWEDGWAQ